LKRLPHGRYAKEFRLDAVKLVEGEGLSWAEAARILSSLLSIRHFRTLNGPKGLELLVWSLASLPPPPFGHVRLHQSVIES
jgi:hypothetical protein